MIKWAQLALAPGGDTVSEKRFFPVVVLTIGILAVSTASIFIRYAQADAPSLVIAAYRLSIAGLLLLFPMLKRHRHTLRALSRRELALALVSGTFLAVHFATWISSLAYTTVASSVVLVTTTPLWVGLLSPLVLGESLTVPVLVGMAATLVGGSLIGVGDACTGSTCNWAAAFSGGALWGDFLALVGAWAAAGYFLIGRRLRAKTPLLVYIGLTYGMAALVLDALVFLARQPVTGYRPQTYLWFLLLALVPQLVGHTSFNWALRYLSAAFVAITLLGEPVGSTLLAYFFLHEVPTTLTLIGAILILGGIAVASLHEKRAPVPEAP
jgi:drug/metabolite transporter (DMT)-like permease